MYFIWQKKKSRISDIREKLLYETGAEFNTKIKCITVLAFLLVSDFIDGYDLPPRLGSLFWNTLYCVWRHRIELTYPIVLGRPKRSFGCFPCYRKTRTKFLAQLLQLCLTLCDPMDCSLLGSYPWDFPGRILEWIAISFSRGLSWPRDQTYVSCI